MTLMLRHCQYPILRFTTTMTTIVVCVLVRRRAACSVLHLAVPFQLPSRVNADKRCSHLILSLQVVVKDSKSPCNLHPVVNEEARVSFTHIGK